jgi:hypothetical protein
MMVKDTKLDLPEGTPVEATLKVGGAPFPAVSGQMQGHDEIGLFPQHGNALLGALEKGSVFELRASRIEDKYEFSVQGGVIGWVRACARRNGIALEHAGQ